MRQIPIFICCTIGFIATQSGCTMNGLHKTVSQDLQTAIAPNATEARREAATMRLDENEQRSLRRLLSGRLPGNWDINSLNDIRLLALVGDESSIRLLRQIATQNQELSGQFGFTVQWAIGEIQNHLGLEVAHQYTLAPL